MTPSTKAARGRGRAGFTLIELGLVLAIVGILAALGGSRYAEYLERARRTQVVVDLKSTSTEVKGYRTTAGALPPDLEAVGAGGRRDLWGNEYVYVRIEDAPRGHVRKDRFIVPINSDFDLYSKGPDGRSRAPLTAEHSRDDIIRANDGSYFGAASRY